MPKNREKTIEMDKKLVPGGYICKQRIDEVLMSNSEILRDLEAVIGVNTSREEMYRIIARVINQVHKSNSALAEIKLIYE